MKYIIGTTLLVLGIVAYAFLGSETSMDATLRIGDSEITVLVADEPDELRTGLGSRDALPADTAMLFVFPRVARHGIWMKDMRFPIDIIWLDEDEKVVDVRERIAPETYPEVFYPSGESRYVVELASGSARELGIQIGTEMAY